MRLTLDVEAQQSFEFLSEQVHGLRKAFSTLSDVLVEEVDLLRSEAVERNEDIQQRFEQQAKGLKAARTEIALLRSEAATGRAALQTKASSVEERLDALQDDLTVLAQEVAKGGSAHHLLQLEAVQLKSQLEEEVRERKAEQEAAAQRAAELREKLENFDSDARASSQALDVDLSTLRSQSERQLTAQASAIEANKGKLLQCAQAIEKQWSSSKVQQQRLESVHASSTLQAQQIQVGCPPPTRRVHHGHATPPIPSHHTWPDCTTCSVCMCRSGSRRSISSRAGGAARWRRASRPSVRMYSSCRRKHERSSRPSTLARRSRGDCSQITRVRPRGSATLLAGLYTPSPTR